MRLLVDIDDRLFRECRKLTKAKQKRQVVVIPMEEYVLRKRREELANMAGNFDYGMTLKQLKAMRREWDKS